MIPGNFCLGGSLEGSCIGQQCLNFWQVGWHTFACPSACGTAWFPKKIFGANHLLGGNVKILLKIIVTSIQKISNDAHS